MKQRVLLGMSGGTDSSVAAMLLMEHGYDVKGITFRFWDDENAKKHLEDAVSLARQLNIEHIIKDARELFYEKVVTYFIDEYIAGRTPFPCAKCNNELKWKLLFEEADRLGCEKVSMGHYVNNIYENGHYYITKGMDDDKDQSFFLWGLYEKQISRIIFPLGNYTKKEVRNIAAKKGYHYVSTKKDSLGVCFCSGDYRDFLKAELKDKYNEYVFPGNYLDENGNIIGQHQGYPLYTVGQRRGLDLYLNRAIFVKSINPKNNEIVLASLNSLYKRQFTVTDYRLTDIGSLTDNFDIITRIRYRKQHSLSRINVLNEHTLIVELKEPVESIAPGQTAVFYQNDKVIGGGFIK